MDISKSFIFIQEDQNWIVKLLIVGLITMIPIVGPLYLYGWMMEISKRTELGKGGILPDVDFSTFLSYGFKYFIVELIYSLPFILIWFAMMFVGAAPLSSDNAFINFIGMIFMLALTVVVLVYAVLMSAFSSAAYIRVMDTGSIQSGLEFGKIADVIKRNPRDFLILIGMSIVYSFLASLGAILCCVGILFTLPLTSAAFANLIGQLSATIKRGGEPSETSYAAPKPVQPAAPSAPVTIPTEIELEPMKGKTAEIKREAAEAAAEVSEGIQDAVDEIKAEVSEAAAEVGEGIDEAVEETKPETEDNENLE